MPSFADQGGPFAGMSGRIMGQAPADTAERAALASLYTVLLADYQLSRLGAQGAIVVDGNFARNPVFMGVLAALRHSQPVEACISAGGAARGAAALAVWPKPFGAMDV